MGKYVDQNIRIPAKNMPVLAGRLVIFFSWFSSGTRTRRDENLSIKRKLKAYWFCFNRF